MNNKFWSIPFAVPATIVGVSLMLSAVVGAYTFYRVRSFDNSLSVVGSAKQAVMADSAKWQSSVSRIVPAGQLQSGYTQLARDSAVVIDFLKKNGISDEALDVSPVFVEERYDYNNQGPREYTLRQNLTVESKDVNQIADLAKRASQLINQGVFFSPGQPEYYYSGLASLRVSLLADAIKDARARAEQLAVSSGQRVGALKSAASGVVQVLSPNSIDVSDYGQYDTSSIAKEVMVTVRASFVVR